MTDKQLPPASQQPESAAHQYMKQVVDKDMEKVYKALGRVQPIIRRARELSTERIEHQYDGYNTSCTVCGSIEFGTACTTQQPEAARVDCICDDAMHIDCPACNPEQPARDVVDVMTALCDLAQDADQFDGNLASEILSVVCGYCVPQPPQPADGEAVGEIIANYETDAGTETVASITKPVPVGAKLYLHPARGVEADAEMLARALNAQPFGLSNNDATRVWELFKDGVRTDLVMNAALQAALSGVQR